jgi:hypothetical protein
MEKFMDFNMDINSKIASSLQNLFVYSMVKSVSDGYFPY